MHSLVIGCGQFKRRFIENKPLIYKDILDLLEIYIVTNKHSKLDT
jgi:hypothetical protein